MPERIVIATNTDIESSVAYYYDESGVDDTIADKGIVCKDPVDGTNRMKKISGGKEAATPGAVLPSTRFQLQPVNVPEDTAAPTVEDLTEKTEIKQTEDLIVTADAKDNLIVKNRCFIL